MPAPDIPVQTIARSVVAPVAQVRRRSRLREKVEQQHETKAVVDRRPPRSCERAYVDWAT